MDKARSAASLSIEPFEVSRSRLRRTRQQPVWISNGILVLGRAAWNGVKGAGRVDLMVTIAFQHRSGAREWDAFWTGSNAGAHFQRSGSPARVTSQEAGSARKCPAHVFGWADDVLTHEAQ